MGSLPFPESDPVSGRDGALTRRGSAASQTTTHHYGGGVERTGKTTTFDVPPSGFTMLTRALPGFAMSSGGILAVIFASSVKLVGRADPFQRTTAPGAKPKPRTLSLNPFTPALTQSGSIRALICGV